jgi:hypothetical protein
MGILLFHPFDLSAEPVRTPADCLFDLVQGGLGWRVNLNRTIWVDVDGDSLPFRRDEEDAIGDPGVTVLQGLVDH